MANLVLTTSVKSPETVVGSSLFVESTLTSTETGAQLAAVQSPQSESRFEYTFSSAGRDDITVSWQALQMSRQQHGMLGGLGWRQPLRPGESVTYDEDVAGYFISPPPPGDYELHVRWRAFDGEVVSCAPIPLRIVPMRPVITAQVVDLTGIAVITAFVQGQELYTRESASGRPDLGSARVRHHAAAGPLQGIALASDLDEVLEWRWSAWLEGDAFGAAIGWGQEVVREVAPGAHGLEDARLLPFGWQLADGTAYFVILGAVGAQSFADVVQLPKGAPPQHHHIDLGGPAPLAAAATMLRVAPGTVELLRADPTGAGVSLASQRLDLQQPRADAPFPLGTLPGALLALGFAPLLGTAGVVDALAAAPAGAPDGLTFVRTPLSGGAAETWSLAPLRVEGALAEPTYHLAQVPHPGAPVLAHVGRELYLAFAAGGGGWSRIATSTHGISNARLEHLSSPDGTDPTNLLYATWFDDSYGFSVQNVTGPYAT